MTSSKMAIKRVITCVSCLMNRSPVGICSSFIINYVISYLEIGGLSNQIALSRRQPLTDSGLAVPEKGSTIEPMDSDDKKECLV